MSYKTPQTNSGSSSTTRCTRCSGSRSVSTTTTTTTTTTTLVSQNEFVYPHWFLFCVQTLSMMQMNKALSEHILGGSSSSKSRSAAASNKRKASPSSSKKGKGESASKKSKKGGAKPARAQPQLKLSKELQAVLGHKTLARTEVRLPYLLPSSWYAMK